MRVDNDPVTADLVSVDEQSWRNQLERHSSIRHAIRPSLAETLTHLESSRFIASCTKFAPEPIPVAPEVPMTAMTDAKGPETVARRAIRAARRLSEV